MLKLSRLAAVLALTLVACAEHDHERTPSTTPETPATPAAPASLTTTGNAFELDRADFGVELLRAAGTAHENVMLSPHSVSLSLAMAYAGARGETEAEMQRALHLGSDAHDRFHALAADLATRNQESVELHVANAVWGQKDARFRPDFLDRMSTSYGSAFHTADFVNDSANEVKTINAWVDDATKHKIPMLFQQDAITNETRLVITNAVYLKASWQQAFENAWPLSFAGTTEPAAMMTTKRDFAYRKGDDFEAVAIPYEGGNIEMLAIVPTGDLASFEASLTGTKILDLLDTLKPQGITLTLPKWHFEGDYALNATLARMGMPTAFVRKQADFTGMATPTFLTQDLYISSVVHKTYIDVSLEGTEAAAATGVVMSSGGAAGGPDPTLHVTIDRPFVTAIVDRPTKTLLFLGHVVKPSTCAELGSSGANGAGHLSGC